MGIQKDYKTERFLVTKSLHWIDLGGRSSRAKVIGEGADNRRRGACAPQIRLFRRDAETNAQGGRAPRTNANHALGTIGRYL
jgi:hypothetical protein